MRHTDAEMIGKKKERKIRDYTVVSRIGTGRYGVCFLARDPAGKMVVLKRFRTGMRRKHPDFSQQEAVILSGLDHPAVPELLGVINDRSGYYFVLEYQKGKTLKEWLFEEKKFFSDEEVFRIGSDLLDVLQYLHERNVVHGDISVANVVYDGSRAALIDFGLSGYADGDSMRFSLDYARFANVLLYLLYSGYSGDGKKPWYEALPLSDGQKDYLQKMLRPEEVFRSTREACREFDRCFGNIRK
ncbi:MAG: serine/threonine protein kinase [Merdimonas faecis]|uniref:serine/threonine protein kinase n=2 Tax=Merdimonas faecis TaxID=1653435 RepID=UPI00159F0323|nr:protein kinase family protein [Merdimonas faecis]